MIITRDDSAVIRPFQHFLRQHFEMKDPGTLSYLLGLEVISSSDRYYLSHANYASDLLSKAGITDNKTVSTPLEYNAKLTPLDGEPISDATRYRQLVGSLIYLTITRPDISHAVGMVSKFMDAPRSIHFGFFDMSRAHFIMVSTTRFGLLSCFMLIQMRVGQVI